MRDDYGMNSEEHLGFTAHSYFVALHHTEEPGMFYFAVSALEVICLHVPLQRRYF